MCGITSFSGFKNMKANPMALKFLLLYNETRGQDAMGFYSLESGIVKKSGKPRELLGEEKFKIPLTNQFLGHVRAVSSGGNGDERSHPFQHGNIILAMNGTLTNHFDLANNLYKIDHSKIYVDSDYLCAMLNKTQSKEPFEKIKGSCACVYIDTNTNKMYVYRNDDRPLFKGFLEEGMYISSTEESLKAIECSKIEEFPKDVLHEIVNGFIIKTYNVKRWVDPIVTTPIRNTIYNNTLKKTFRRLDVGWGGKDTLKGKWLSPVVTFILHNSAVFNEERRYLVMEESLDSEIAEYNMYSDYSFATTVEVFHPETNKIYTTSLSRFKELEPIIEKNDYCLVTKNIVTSDDKIFAKKGELVVVDSVLIQGFYTKVEVRRYATSDICILSNGVKDLIRWATPIEWKEWVDANVKNKMSKNLEKPNTFKVLTEEEIYEQTLIDKSKKIEFFNDFLNFFFVELNDHITDLDHSISDVYEQSLISKIKVLTKFFNKEKEEYSVKEEEEIENGG